MRDASVYWLRRLRSNSTRFSDRQQDAPRDARQQQPRLRWPIQIPRRDMYALRFGAATVFATIVPFILGKLGLAARIYNEMTAVDFDADRALLIEFALLVFIGALTAGIVLRWRAPVWLGALVYFVVRYLLPYVGQVSHPPLAPNGTSQILVPSALATIIATLLAVGLIFSGAGAVLGDACGRVFATPLIALCRLILVQAGLLRSVWLSKRLMLAALSALMTSGVIIIALVLVANNLDTMLNYGTIATLYRPGRMAALQGTIEQEAYPSPALGSVWRQYMIYLPPSYASSSQKRYAVVYLLHGNPGRFTNWFAGAHVDTTSNTLISTGKIHETILVAPDGNGKVYPVSDWANSFDTRQRMEDSIVDDLVPYIDKHYRTLADPAHRAIAGISEGGFGAVNIDLHHPDVFGTVLSLSGF